MEIVVFLLIVFLVVYGLVKGYLKLIGLAVRFTTFEPTPQRGLSWREGWALRFALLGGSALPYLVEDPFSGYPSLYFVLGIIMPIATLMIAGTDRPEEFALLGNAGFALQLLLINTQSSGLFRESTLNYMAPAIGFAASSLINSVPFVKAVQRRERLRSAMGTKPL